MPKKIYDQLAGETSKAFRAFRVYRDLGAERTVRGAAEAAPTAIRYAELWCSKFNWVARARAFDTDMDRAGYKAEMREIAKMRARQARLGLAMQTVASTELQKIAKKARDEGTEVLKPDEVVRLAEYGAKLERVARGEPDAITEVKGEVEVLDYSKLTPEELHALRSAKLKLKGKE